MKLYHKFFLYQNKWIHPYIRVALGVMTALTYLASILLIVGLVYEHGFTIRQQRLTNCSVCTMVCGLFFWLIYPYISFWSIKIRGRLSVC